MEGIARCTDTRPSARVLARTSSASRACLKQRRCACSACAAASTSLRWRGGRAPCSTCHAYSVSAVLMALRVRLDRGAPDTRARGTQAPPPLSPSSCNSGTGGSARPSDGGRRGVPPVGRAASTRRSRSPPSSTPTTITSAPCSSCTTSLPPPPSLLPAVALQWRAQKH